MIKIRQSKNKPPISSQSKKCGSHSAWRLSFPSSFLIISLFVIVLSSGCIGQAPAGTGGISIRTLADPPSIRSDECQQPDSRCSLFVDVENKDTSQFIKVFVEAFDTGPFEAVRASTVPSRQGTLPVPGSYIIEFGQTNFNITVNKPCSSDTQCFDEEYGGCGLCQIQPGAFQGTCQPAVRARGVGEPCIKPCECSPGLACRRDLDGISKCLLASSTCTDGTPLNTCRGALFCSPFGGELQPGCGGLDSIPSSAFFSQSGQLGRSDDCDCPFGTVCKGDGTCGLPSGCFTTIFGMKPGDLRTLECALRLKNPQSIIQSTTADIQLRTVFRKRLEIDETLQFLSLEEFRREETIGKLARKPQTFSASDQALQLAIGYTKQPPFVAGDKVLMRLEIRSVGSGTVALLNPNDIVIGQPGDKIKCNIETPLRSDRGVFPPITCEISPGQVENIETYPFNINVYYDYEVRSSLPISIEKV